MVLPCAGPLRSRMGLRVDLRARVRVLQAKYIRAARLPSAAQREEEACFQLARAVEARDAGIARLEVTAHREGMQLALYAQSLRESYRSDVAEAVEERSRCGAEYCRAQLVRLKIERTTLSVAHSRRLRLLDTAVAAAKRVAVRTRGDDCDEDATAPESSLEALQSSLAEAFAFDGVDDDFLKENHAYVARTHGAFLARVRCSPYCPVPPPSHPLLLLAPA